MRRAEMDFCLCVPAVLPKTPSSSFSTLHMAALGSSILIPILLQWPLPWSSPYRTGFRTKLKPTQVLFLFQALLILSALFVCLNCIHVCGCLGSQLWRAGFRNYMQTLSCGLWNLSSPMWDWSWVPSVARRFLASGPSGKSQYLFLMNVCWLSVHEIIF